MQWNGADEVEKVDAYMTEVAQVYQAILYNFLDESFEMRDTITFVKFKGEKNKKNITLYKYDVFMYDEELRQRRMVLDSSFFVVRYFKISGKNQTTSNWETTTGGDNWETTTGGDNWETTTDGNNWETTTGGDNGETTTGGDNWETTSSDTMRMMETASDDYKWETSSDSYDSWETATDFYDNWFDNWDWETSSDSYDNWETSSDYYDFETTDGPMMGRK